MALRGIFMHIQYHAVAYNCRINTPNNLFFMVHVSCIAQSLRSHGWWSFTYKHMYVSEHWPSTYVVVCFFSWYSTPSRSALSIHYVCMHNGYGVICECKCEGKHCTPLVLPFMTVNELICAWLTLHVLYMCWIPSSISRTGCSTYMSYTHACRIRLYYIYIYICRTYVYVVLRCSTYVCRIRHICRIHTYVVYELANSKACSHF